MVVDFMISLYLTKPLAFMSKPRRSVYELFLQLFLLLDLRRHSVALWFVLLPAADVALLIAKERHLAARALLLCRATAVVACISLLRRLRWRLCNRLIAITALLLDLRQHSVARRFVLFPAVIATLLIAKVRRFAAGALFLRHAAAVIA
jgi:hypothetical protein